MGSEMEEKPFTKEELENWIELTRLHPSDLFGASTVQRMGYQLIQAMEDLERLNRAVESERIFLK